MTRWPPFGTPCAAHDFGDVLRPGAGPPIAKEDNPNSPAMSAQAKHMLQIGEQYLLQQPTSSGSPLEIHVP